MSQHLVSELRRQASDIRQLGRGIRRAQLEALDATAMDVRDAEVLEIDDSFDRPTPFTRNAVFVQRTRGGVPEARVGLKDDGGGQRAAKRWLEPGIEGGSRQLKALETLVGRLAARDGFSPIGASYMVPGPYARLDAFGNVSRGQIVQVMSQLRLFTGAESVSRNLVRRNGSRDVGNASTAKKAAQLRNAAFRRAGGQFFVVPPGARGGLRPGIYQRQVASRRLTGAASPKPRPVFWFVDRVSYEQRFNFWRAGQLAIDRGYPRHLDAALARHTGAAA